jgi:hypothetical protein
MALSRAKDPGYYATHVPGITQEEIGGLLVESHTLRSIVTNKAEGSPTQASTFLISNLDIGPGGVPGQNVRPRRKRVGGLNSVWRNACTFSVWWFFRPVHMDYGYTASRKRGDFAIVSVNRSQGVITDDSVKECEC